MALRALDALDHASMRPRVFPAEDRRVDDDGNLVLPASMRPRVFPAEDLLGPRQFALEYRGASMRPRVFPAEDLDRLRPVPVGLRRFNEAAGIPRGRLRGRHTDARSRHANLQGASMRPRVFPAEDPGAQF